MTKNNYPITPPPELVDKIFMLDTSEEGRIIAAYKAGADAELEACCEWLKTKEWIHPEFSDELRDLRRPKPPSLKEQAISALDQLSGHVKDIDQVRRAIEQLPDTH
jgi:hypothetical protein